MLIHRRDALKTVLAALALGACRRRPDLSASPAPAVIPASGTPAPAVTAQAPAPAPSPGGILPDGQWNPARTWVFAVGILSWRDAATYASFPTIARRDAQLVERFRARGVPANQVTHVTDTDATRAGILAALEQVMQRVQPGDLFWFYYAGHGVLDEDGTMFMVPYDTADNLAQTAWSLPSLLATLDARHRGPVLMTADCCHSGAMAAAAAATPRPQPYAALSSSLSSEESTGNWTFTECLIAGLDGSMTVAAADAPTSTLQRLADFTVQRMADEEEQLASFATAHGFPAALRLGPAAAARDPRVGTYVEAQSDNRWYPARIEAVREDGQLRVHYAGFPDAQNEWVAPAQVRPRVVRQFDVGATVDAEWHGRWYPAVVLAQRLGIHQVHYDGFEDVWNEWVSSRRVRPRTA